MRAKIRMPIQVLRRASVPHAIRKRSLQHIVVASDHVHVLVHNNTRQILTHTLTHDTRFAMMHCEPFLQQNRRGANRKAVCASLKILSA